MSARIVSEDWKRAVADEDRASRFFNVETDAADEGPVVARRATGLPYKNQPHPKDPWLICQGNRLASVEGPVSFVIESYYAKRTTPTGSGSNEGNPLDFRPVIRQTWMEIIEPLDYGLENLNPLSQKLLANSAGDPFDPPATETIYVPVSVVIRPEPTWTLAKALQYNDRLNSDTVFGCPPGTLWLRCEGEQQWSGDWPYWSVTYQLAYLSYVLDGKKIGWQRRFLDQGFRRVVQSGSTVSRVPIKDLGGGDTTVPRKLDGQGRPLAEGAPAVWILRYTKWGVPFGPLRLPL